MGNGRIAQTFSAINSGVLSAAQAQQVVKPSGSKGDFILQIGTVNQSTGVPDSFDNVIASAIVPDSTVPADTPAMLTGTFADPPSVVAGQQYALILIRPSSLFFLWSGDPTNPCGGSGFTSTSQADPFLDVGFDFLFTTFVTV